MEAHCISLCYLKVKVLAKNQNYRCVIFYAEGAVASSRNSWSSEFIGTGSINNVILMDEPRDYLKCHFKNFYYIFYSRYLFPSHFFPLAPPSLESSPVRHSLPYHRWFHIPIPTGGFLPHCKCARVIPWLVHGWWSLQAQGIGDAQKWRWCGNVRAALEGSSRKDWW